LQAGGFGFENVGRRLFGPMSGVECPDGSSDFHSSTNHPPIHAHRWRPTRASGNASREVRARAELVYVRVKLGRPQRRRQSGKSYIRQLARVAVITLLLMRPCKCSRDQSNENSRKRIFVLEQCVPTHCLGEESKRNYVHRGRTWLETPTKEVANCYKLWRPVCRD
jgi:hypothetical protein